MGGRRVRTGVVAVCAGIAALIFAVPSHAATFTVTNGNDSGAGSLRQAITDAEANGNDPTIDQIEITFVGDIDLLSQLPPIATPLTIAGTGVSNVNVRRSAGAVTQFRLFAVLPSAGNTVVMQNLTISGARANNFAGAAISMSGLGNLILNSVSLEDNRALGGAGQGGAIYYDRGFTSIRNSTLSANQANAGGAIRGSSNGADDGLGELINVTVAGNSATSFGGGIELDGEARITVGSSTIFGNTADSNNNGTGNGGGVRNNSTGTAPVFSFANTILAGNAIGTTSPVAEQCRGAFVSDDYNLRTTADGSCTGFTGTNDLIDANPLLGALGINVAGPPTIALEPGSPAINTGNPATPGGAYPACPATDERALPRGALGNRCDIGAFEVQRNTTTTALVCAPTSLMLGTESTNCTATVTDSGSSAPLTTPTGTVNFSAGGTGAFDPTGCELTMLSASEASCEVSYTPSVGGARLITGAYAGDADHDISQGSAQVDVQSPPSPAPVTPTTPPSNPTAAIKKCKKKFPKGKKRKKCIKRAKKRAGV
jgi:hypothetical protein